MHRYEKLVYNKTIKYLAINANIQHLTFVKHLTYGGDTLLCCYQCNV